MQTQLDNVAAIFAVSQLLLSMVLLIQFSKPIRRNQWLLFLFMSAVLAYVSGPLIQTELVFQLHLTWQTLVPGLFWLLCGSLFDDDFDLAAWKLSLVLMTVVPPTIGNFFDFDHDGFVGFGVYWLPQALEFILLAWALAIVIRNWQDDLVPERRGLRFWFCLTAGGYSFLMIAVREVLFPEALWWQDWQYIFTAIICLGTNALLLQYPKTLFETQEVKTRRRIPRTTYTSREPEEGVPSPVLKKLQTLLEDQKEYRKMGLTIGQVANLVEIPEHQLRKIINAGLGYRNFNSYLNEFRIGEAQEILNDPEMRDEPIVNIALDIGFRSLSSFNKAFKGQTGLTPTEFRQKSLTDFKK